MADTAPGRVTDDSGWPGRWETITREDYHAVIAANGGLKALTVASACTRVDERYFLTAWARRDQDYPLVQNVLEGCDQSLPYDQYARCPGKHTFSRFIYDPSQVEG